MRVDIYRLDASDPNNIRKILSLKKGNKYRIIRKLDVDIALVVDERYHNQLVILKHEAVIVNEP